jgi:hypothetical protein
MGKLARHFTVAAWLTAMSVASCTPTIEIAPPSEPITINLNIKIEHEIKIKVARELDDLFEAESDIF